MSSEEVGGDEALGKAALMEMGNIMANSYLNAMAALMGMKILLSVPSYACDYLGSVIDALLIEISEVSESALLMKTELNSDETSFTGNFIILPDGESFDKMLGKMGIK